MWKRGRADLEHNRSRTRTTGLRHFRAKIESNKHGISVTAKQIELSMVTWIAWHNLVAKNFTDYGNYSLEFLTLLRTDEAWDLARAQGSLFCFRIFCYIQLETKS